MEKHYYFDRNLLALSTHNEKLCAQLSSAHTTGARYRFIEGKNGQNIPAWVDGAGTAHTLHSLIAPEREAEKLAASFVDEGYVVLLGLGAGYLAEAALKREGVHKVLVIDYDIDGVAELVCSNDYIGIFGDSRFTLIVDADYAAIVSYITKTYYPCMHNGIRVMPLRARCDFDEARFNIAADAVRDAIDRVSSDYSVQAHFGKRWFSNIIRNVIRAETQHGIIPPAHNIAVCAAGPSLDIQLETLYAHRGDRFIIATDTAFGSLLAAGIQPHAVISIDCQHISYLHFMNGGFTHLADITLFLDIASPPLLAAHAPKSFFFCGGHPLAKYIGVYFKQFLELDTSGGNVTYAAISLAEQLGARNIELYGADFAYPNGIAYTKGAYFYPYLRNRQSRLRPALAQAMDFLFAIPSLAKHTTEYGYYYETRSLTQYRIKLEERARVSPTNIIPVAGSGAPIRANTPRASFPFDNTIKIFAGGRTLQSAASFLRDYRGQILELPLPKDGIGQYLYKLNPQQRMVWTTLLPSAAALKQREARISARELIACVKETCAAEISRVL